MKPPSDQGDPAVATTTTTTTNHADMTNTARCSNHCNLREGQVSMVNGGPDLTQVAVIAAASCRVGHICMVSGGGGCSCKLLLHPVPTSADAGPDLCTLCPDLCTLHPDLWTCVLVVFPFFQLVQAFHLLRWWLSPAGTCAGGAFSFSH